MLYSARVAPSLDTAIGDVVKDLQLVLSKAEYVNFLTEYLRMMPALAKDISPEVMNQVLNDMKMSPVGEAFLVNE